jgi:cytochrome c-type biogenesis protein
MDISQITIGVAFVAGVLSFFSPCVFALVPAYIGYLTGRTVGQGEKANPLVTFLHGVFFVLGFSVVFVLLGVAAASLGGVLYQVRDALAVIGGLIVIVFGIHMIGIYRIPFLEYDLRKQEAPDPRYGYLSSALMGVFFSAGWSPCVGPVLGAILTLAINGGSVSLGATLLSAYSLGLAIPFLVAALGIGWVTKILKKYANVMRIAEIVMGVLLVIVGIMLATGTFEILSRYGSWFSLGY